MVPESTLINWPVIDLDLSEIKNSTVLDTDCKSVKRFKEVLFFILFFKSSPNVELISVSIKPATTQFDLIPFSPHSLDAFFENASNEPLLEAYIDKPL